jgi:hypothetical protein
MIGLSSDNLEWKNKLLGHSAKLREVTGLEMSNAKA